MDSELPVHRVTIDQIVARNIRFLRRAAGMTQEDLGEAVGWTAANVSAAERSADDHRDRRRFDAGTVVAFAQALGVPLLALFLPPADEGNDARYVFSTGDGECGEWQDMASLMRTVYPDSDSDTPLMDRYRTWLTHHVEHLMDPQWARALAAWLGRREPRDVLVSRARRIRAALYAANDAAADLREMADALDAEIEAGEGA